MGTTSLSDQGFSSLERLIMTALKSVRTSLNVLVKSI